MNWYTKFYFTDASSLNAWTRVMLVSQNGVKCCTCITFSEFQFIESVTHKQVRCSGIEEYLEDQDKVHMNEKVGRNCKCFWDRSHAKINRKNDCKSESEFRKSIK